ncbi:hypothetical protein [Cellulomonas phragmiteti]|uniref:Lipoprotein n=1 Tax=Cellulomonas phragmiteti TaxID=478780 RepID=A0ABQ4DIM4_9CELL|nr:hypothetical protein [Cellulomonas phragmiteti]GIG39205.1 hypothetical protein Cph01nite_09670 [Cellulomonas phragmiteti]
MTASTAATRQILSAVVLAVTCALTTTGCVYDAPPPRWADLVNERRTAVTLTFDGSAAEPQEIPARQGNVIRYEGEPIREEDDPCVDVGATVTDTTTGQVLGTVDPPICAETRIYVREDGTVEVR